MREGSGVGVAIDHGVLPRFHDAGIAFRGWCRDQLPKPREIFQNGGHNGSTVSPGACLLIAFSVSLNGTGFMHRNIAVSSRQDQFGFFNFASTAVANERMVQATRGIETWVLMAQRSWRPGRRLKRYTLCN